MSELFPQKELAPDPSAVPLADRIRPKTIDEVLGQDKLLGSGGPLRKFFAKKSFPSMIFWGPPGVGKTTVAYLIADNVDGDFRRLSAIEAGVKDVRQVISSATAARKSGRKTVLFIDEIHRFNKSQQDALLRAVEQGVITIIGATTENPSFEVNAALLSRCQVYRLFWLTDEDIRKLIERAVQTDPILKELEIKIVAWDFLLAVSGGDARTALNALETAVAAADSDEEIIIDRALLESALQQKTARYDKKGDSHYDTISAFIKSLRGSDPDAALFWMAKMIEAGEDPKFIARRMVIFASEDVGNADPFALSLAVSVFDAVNLIGYPECSINLFQGCTYLASAPKSNRSYLAGNAALKEIRSGAPTSPPMHLRNAPTKLMKREGYSKGYKYPHDYDNDFVKENYFPEGYEPRAFYEPGDLGREKTIKERLRFFWPERYED